MYDVHPPITCGFAVALPPPLAFDASLPMRPSSMNGLALGRRPSPKAGLHHAAACNT
jgi:hypothetical protein